MAATTPPTITDLPAVPDRADRATFSARATALFDMLKNTSVAEWRAAAANVYANAVDAFTSASTATEQAALAISAKNDAQTAQAAAQAVSGATQWVSGTSYALGAVVWSPSNGQNYRRKVAGAGTTDPSLDPTNWYSMNSMQGLTSAVISTNTSALAGRHYVATANCTVTLPASPTVNDVVAVTALGAGVTALVVARNGQPINALAEDLTIDKAWTTAQLIYTGAANGWVIS